MEKNNIDASQYEIVFILKPPGLGGWYGFHKKTDPKVLETLQNGLDELISEGVVDRIASPYFNK